MVSKLVQKNILSMTWMSIFLNLPTGPFAENTSTTALTFEQISIDRSYLKVSHKYIFQINRNRKNLNQERKMLEEKFSMEKLKICFPIS